MQFVNTLLQCNSVKIRGEKENRRQMKEGERLGRWEGEIKPGQMTEFGRWQRKQSA
jgi:hypothetical protein